MGLDGLDLIFRLEKAFSVKLGKSAGERLFWSEQEIQSRNFVVSTVTSGEIHERLCMLLGEMNVLVPVDSWDRVTKCLGEVLKIEPADIRPHHRMVQDLGAS